MTNFQPWNQKIWNQFQLQLTWLTYFCSFFDLLNTSYGKCQFINFIKIKFILFSVLYKRRLYKIKLFKILESEKLLLAIFK